MTLIYNKKCAKRLKRNNDPVIELELLGFKGIHQTFENNDIIVFQIENTIESLPEFIIVLK